MQSIEGGAWRSLFLSLVRKAWKREENREVIAFVLELSGQPPDRLTDEDVCEAVQKILLQTVASEFEPFGMGPNMPSQWANPAPILRVKTAALHAGVGEEAVRAAIRRGALQHVYIDGSYFVRVSDAENYYGAWDSDKSDRIVYEMRQYGRISICNGIAYLLDPLETVSPQ